MSALMPVCPASRVPSSENLMKDYLPRASGGRRLKEMFPMNAADPEVIGCKRRVATSTKHQEIDSAVAPSSRGFNLSGRSFFQG
jgi:hypothetical protein